MENYEIVPNLIPKRLIKNKTVPTYKVQHATIKIFVYIDCSFEVNRYCYNK
jgi:hypothetical protein